VTTRGKRMPEFFSVGQHKSGTTALYEMLRRHPGIFMPSIKEPLFLASDTRWRFYPPRTPPMPTTLDQYLALFADARDDQRTGEASASYLSSHTAAASIAKLNPAARVIVVFREPTAFLRSFHLQMLQTHNENKHSLRDALALESARREGRRVPRRSYAPHDLMYSEHVRYTDQLRRYHAVLPREQVLVLIYEEFRGDNAAAVREIFRFLDVDDSISAAPTHANPTVSLRSQALDAAVHRFSVGRDPYSRAIKAGVKTFVPEVARRRLLQTVQEHVVNSAAPPPDEELATELRKQLKPEVERFGAYLDRDLVSFWGYDQVA
jgi:hypothetical protein